MHTHSMRESFLVAVPPAHSFATHGSYKRVKGRSHAAEDRTSMHSHGPHATSQPAITVLTHAQLHCPTSTATRTAPCTCPIMTSALALQSQHRNANPAHVR